jgi:hypothetical protein
VPALVSAWRSRSSALSGVTPAAVSTEASTLRSAPDGSRIGDVFAFRTVKRSATTGTPVTTPVAKPPPAITTEYAPTGTG